MSIADANRMKALEAALENFQADISNDIGLIRAVSADVRALKEQVGALEARVAALEAASHQHETDVHDEVIGPSEHTPRPKRGRPAK